MQALTKNFTDIEALKQALEAGTHIVEYRDMEYTHKCLEELKKSIKNREISSDLISRKVEKICLFKRERLGLLKNHRPEAVSTDFAKKFLVELNQKLID